MSFPVSNTNRQESFCLCHLLNIKQRQNDSCVNLCLLLESSHYLLNLKEIVGEYEGGMNLENVNLEESEIPSTSEGTSITPAVPTRKATKRSTCFVKSSKVIYVVKQFYG